MALKTPRAAKTRKTAEKKLSRLRKPDDMSLAEWQTALRRQFGRQQTFQAEERGREGNLLRVRGLQSGDETDLSRGHPGRGRGRKLLLLPGLRRQHAGHLQARRVHAGEAGEETRRQAGAGRGLSTVLLRGVSPLRRQAGGDVSAGDRCPAGVKRLAGALLRRRRPAAARGLRPFHEFLKKAGSNGHELRCYDDALAMVAQVRDRAELAERISGGLSAGHPQPGLRQAAEDPALSLSARRGLVCRHGRPLPCWPTTWGWARRSRPSPPSRSSPAPPASSGCWSSRPPR